MSAGVNFQRIPRIAKGRLLKRVLTLAGVSIVSNTFEQNINQGYDLVLVLITGPLKYSTVILREKNTLF